MIKCTLPKGTRIVELGDDIQNAVQIDVCVRVCVFLDSYLFFNT